MSDPVLIVTITCVTGALQAVTIAFLNRKSNQGQAKTAVIHDEVIGLRQQVNGQTQALLKVTGDSREAIGKLKGKEQKQETEGESKP